MEERHIDPATVSRAQGCLLGQLAGDALGSMVEFQRPEDIRRSYPDRIRELADGGRWDTIAGQPTDDSEMALMLARMLVEQGRYDAEQARNAYRFWLDSSGEGIGKAGGYGIQGRATAMIRFMSGSYSNIVGLPLYEVTQLLRGARYPL